MSAAAIVALAAVALAAIAATVAAAVYYRRAVDAEAHATDATAQAVEHATARATAERDNAYLEEQLYHAEARLRLDPVAAGEHLRRVLSERSAPRDPTGRLPLRAPAEVPGDRRGRGG